MSLKWELLQVVCLAVTIAVGLLGYDRMPERVRFMRISPAM